MAEPAVASPASFEESMLDISQRAFRAGGRQVTRSVSGLLPGLLVVRVFPLRLHCSVLRLMCLSQNLELTAAGIHQQAESPSRQGPSR